MANNEIFLFEDFRILYDSIVYFTNKDYENALQNIKLVSSKWDDLKVKNKSNIEYNKARLSKPEEFRSQLMTVASRLKGTAEHVDKCDQHQIISLLNYALILHFVQQNSYCTKILDLIQKYKSSLDDYSYIQYVMLRMENYLSIQSADCVIKLAENELALKDDNKFTNEHDKYCLDIFRMRAYILNNNYIEASKILEKIKKYDNVLVNRFVEAHYLYFKRKIPEALVHLTNLGSNIELNFDKDQYNYWNNLGCIHFHLNKHNLGIMYFNRSLNAAVNPSAKSKSVSDSNPEKDVSFGRYYEIIHNLGIQLLMANKPIESFDLLLEVVNVYPKNPRLWFRLAECCVKAFRIKESDIYAKSNCVQNVIGTESYKKAILGNETKECKKPWDDVAAMPTPTLEFGSLCIRNAMFLLPNHSHVFENNDTNVENIIEWYKNQCIYLNPGGCIRELDILHLKSSILLNGAYISLSLNNYVEAFRFSEKLLLQPILSHMHKYMARMYMSEAMLMMNRPNDLTNLLNPSTIMNISNNPDINVDTSKDSFDCTARMVVSRCNNIPATLEDAKGIMCYNLAAVSAILRHDKVAEQYISEALKLNPKINKSTYHINLIVYLELLRGKSKNSLKILGEFFSQIPLFNNIEV